MECAVTSHYQHVSSHQREELASWVELGKIKEVSFLTGKVSGRPVLHPFLNILFYFSHSVWGSRKVFVCHSDLQKLASKAMSLLWSL